MRNFCSDDKNMVIVAVMVIAIVVIFAPDLTDPKVTIISSICSGLFGIAVGKNLK
jgi:hypothetical protein